MEAIRIRTDQAEAGMKAASDVYNPQGQLIIPKGTVLDGRTINRLRYYHIYGLVVYPNEVTVEPVSYMEMLRSTPEFKKFNRTYVGSIQNVENNFGGLLEGGQEFDPGKLLAETERILSEGRNGAHILEMLHGIRNYDDLTYVHGLNVSLICNVFGNWLKLPKEDIRILTIAGLLHDIGKMLIPSEIISKAGKLTPEEYKIVKTHAMKGFQVLKDFPVDMRVKYAALMHHERCDGSGYPNGFVAEQIDEFAKIIAIADVYDAMTSSRRYRNAISPFDVIEEFEKDGFLKFDPGYLMVFLERMVESYIHNMVRLSDGREGEVIMINRLSLSRPVVKVGEVYVDLSKERKLSIKEVI
ncbi:putative nucleotidyltransferase with HDIG domain [Anaerotaenia torta]|uniref:HD-GYP domain-containing protein n=1 Tax=Anaerotaenia torta TaxID=433293 RepID=UPI003D21604F